MIGRVPRIAAYALATIVALVGVAIAAILAIDRFAEEYPDRFRYVGVWIEDTLGIGDLADHFAVALELDRPEALLRRLLRHDGAVETEIAGHTLLTLAFDSPPTRAVSPQTLAVILEAGADPNRRDADGRLPIVEAGRYTDPARLAQLLDHGASADGRDHRGYHAVDVVRSGQSSDLGAFVGLLLDHGFDPCALVRPPLPESAVAKPLRVWLAERKLPDLAARAEAACAAKGGGRDGAAAAPAH